MCHRSDVNDFMLYSCYIGPRYNGSRLYVLYHTVPTYLLDKLQMLANICMFFFIVSWKDVFQFTGYWNRFNKYGCWQIMIMVICPWYLNQILFSREIVKRIAYQNTLRVRYDVDGGCCNNGNHYCDIIIGAMAAQITSPTIVYSTVYSGADQRKHQSSASLAFVRGIHRGPVNSPHKWPVTRKMFPFDDVIMITQ